MRRELPKDPGDAAGTTVELAWQYDVRGLPRAARRLRQSADGGSATTFWNYDGFGRPVKTTEPPSCQGSGCVAPVTTRTYDRNDVVTREVLPASDEAVQGRVGTTTGVRRYAIDRADRPTEVDDEAGAHTETLYDADDLVVKRYGARAFVSDEGGAGSAAEKERFATTYRRDGGGRVTRETGKVTDADGTRDLVTSTQYERRRATAAARASPGSGGRRGGGGGEHASTAVDETRGCQLRLTTHALRLRALP